MSVESSSSDSDYDVEQFIHTKRVRRTINDDTADLLGNFDDAKRKQIMDGTYEEKQQSDDESDSANTSDAENGINETLNNDEEISITDEDVEENVETSSDNKVSINNTDVHSNSGISDNIISKNHNTVVKSDQSDNKNEDYESCDSENEHNIITTNLSKEQLDLLLRGSSKVNRHVLYVTNLNFDTTKTDLEQYFAAAGSVKSVRIPKKRRGGFAFVEMTDLNGFQKGFQFHNTILHGRTIRVQISEAGKKKSANKKNIIKQKNRKLAEMRNEQKTFTKSGKFYDKTLKKEKAKELLAKKRWRKKPAGYVEK